MTLVPEGTMVSCGRNERLNTVPLPELPPLLAVPYRALANNINLAYGEAPSLLMPETKAEKLCRVVKPVPSVLTANTVPAPPLPPPAAVPYSVLPDKINSAYGFAPSLFVPE